MSFRPFIWLIFPALLAWGFGPASAARAVSATSGEDRPISITSDRMEADDRQKVITFVGRVVGRQKDVVLNCDVMRIYYTKGETSPTPESKPAEPAAGAPTASSAEDDPLGALGGGENEIDRIECEGNVKVTQGENTLLAEKAVYLASAQPRVIIFTGEPRIWRNKDFLTGKRISYYPDENRSVVEGGGSSRVQTQFYKTPDQREPSGAGEETIR